MKHAAMLPLDYDGNRRETSILYLNGTWEELVDVLEIPSEHFRTEQRLWPQKWPQTVAPIVPHVPWEALPLVTIVLEPASGTLLQTFRLWSLAKAGGKPRDKASIDAFWNNERLRDSTQARQEKLWEKDAAPCGIFLAEFAVRTHTLLIRYTPPEPKKCTQARPGFTGKYDSPSLISVPPYAVGNLHFDIGSDPRQRAEFVLDFIERKPIILDTIKKLALTGPANLVTPMDMPKPVGATKPTKAPNLVFADNFPTVVIEGASATPSNACCVCGDSPVVFNGTAWVVDPLQLKCYACP